MAVASGFLLHSLLVELLLFILNSGRMNPAFAALALVISVIIFPSLRGLTFNFGHKKLKEKMYLQSICLSEIVLEASTTSGNSILLLLFRVNLRRVDLRHPAIRRQGS